MSNKIDQEKLESLAKELAKNIKTEQDLSDLSRTLLKMTVESALGAEMEAHLGYSAHEAKGRNSRNSRNGHSKKVPQKLLEFIETGWRP
ncbi:MAG: transposase [Gammaproteobacteria bacterium]|nr:transposase [Gammaproteobacteria bacterium]